VYDETADALTLSPDAPLAQTATELIRSGRADELERLLREHPELASARLGKHKCRQTRTLLHVVN
jgi:hypothetical protein